MATTDEFVMVTKGHRLCAKRNHSILSNARTEHPVREGTCLSEDTIYKRVLQRK